MRFKEAVEATPGLKGSFKEGLRALPKSDKALVDADKVELVGSVNVDEALKARFPNSPRWDYAIGIRCAGSNDDAIYWIEIHAGSDSELEVIERKLDWLDRWLAGEGRSLNIRKSRRYWVSAGKVSTYLLPNSPRLFRLQRKYGFRFAGRCLKLKPIGL